MSTPTLSAPARAISFGAGAIAAGGALFVLWQQPISTGQWEAAHVLVPIVLALAILAGKLSYVAWRQGVLSSAAGFVVLFGMATAWIVINSVGNQAEVSDHRLASARAAHGAAANLDQRITWLRGRIAEDAARVSDEIRGVRDGRRVQAGCGDVCRGLQRTIEANRALLIDVQRKRAALVLPPINSKAAHWGAIAAFVGLPGQLVSRAVILFEPVVLTLALEFGAILGFGLAFYKPAQLVSGPPRPALRVVSDDPVISELRRGGPAPSQAALADRLGLSKGEVSKRLSELGNAVRRIRGADGSHRIEIAA
jgi:hypothetical protein